jgi:hypothetical protein
VDHERWRADRHETLANSVSVVKIFFQRQPMIGEYCRPTEGMSWTIA